MRGNGNIKNASGLNTSVRGAGFKNEYLKPNFFKQVNMIVRLFESESVSPWLIAETVIKNGYDNEILEKATNKLSLNNSAILQAYLFFPEKDNRHEYYVDSLLLNKFEYTDFHSLLKDNGYNDLFDLRKVLIASLKEKYPAFSYEAEEFVWFTENILKDKNTYNSDDFQKAKKHALIPKSKYYYERFDYVAAEKMFFVKDKGCSKINGFFQNQFNEALNETKQYIKNNDGKISLVNKNIFISRCNDCVDDPGFIQLIINNIINQEKPLKLKEAIISSFKQNFNL